MKVKLDNDGRVFVPKKYLRKLGMTTGCYVELKVEGDELRIVPAKDARDEGDVGPQTEFITGKSPSEATILERRARAARHQFIKARREGKTSEALLLEHYEKLARHLAECYTDGAPVSEDMIRERRNMEKYFWDRAGGQ